MSNFIGKEWAVAAIRCDAANNEVTGFGGLEYTPLFKYKLELSGAHYWFYAAGTELKTISRYGKSHIG